MIPKKGQHVKCVLRNNLILEGIVEVWSDEQSSLYSLDRSSISIIQHTSEEVVVVKIILKSHSQVKNHLEEKFDEVYAQPSDNDLRIKEMAELKILLAEQEKKIISEKIKEHHLGNTKKVTYGQPQFLQKPRAQ